MTLVSLEREGPSGYVPLPRDIVLDRRTGQSPVGTELLSLDGIFSLGQLTAATGGGKFQLSLIAALLGGDSRRSVTSYRNFMVIEEAMPITYCAPGQVLIGMRRPAGPLPASAEPLRLLPQRAGVIAVTPAEELRTLSGLSPVLLARIFGVSRTTYYKWIEGATPRDARFQHLVDVLAHIKEAQQRLSPSVDIAAWLRTPVAPGGKNPLDYLAAQRFSTFRGLLLRATSAQAGFSSPLPSALALPPLSRADYLAGRERVSPTPRIEDPDETGDDAT